MNDMLISAIAAIPPPVVVDLCELIDDPYGNFATSLFLEMWLAPARVSMNVLAAGLRLKGELHLHGSDVALLILQWVLQEGKQYASRDELLAAAAQAHLQFISSQIDGLPQNEDAPLCAPCVCHVTAALLPKYTHADAVRTALQQLPKPDHPHYETLLARAQAREDDDDAHCSAFGSPGPDKALKQCFKVLKGLVAGGATLACVGVPVIWQGSHANTANAPSFVDYGVLDEPLVMLSDELGLYSIPAPNKPISPESVPTPAPSPNPAAPPQDKGMRGDNGKSARGDSGAAQGNQNIVVPGTNEPSESKPNEIREVSLYSFGDQVPGKANSSGKTETTLAGSGDTMQGARAASSGATTTPQRPVGMASTYVTDADTKILARNLEKTTTRRCSVQGVTITMVGTGTISVSAAPGLSETQIRQAINAAKTARHCGG